MTENLARPVVDGLPTRRSCPFAAPTGLDTIRAAAPITRMAYPDGHSGWLVTGFELGRRVLGTAEFSARFELKSSPIPIPVTPPAATPGLFVGMDAPQHTRYRRPLNQWFSARRIRALEPAIERISAQLLDELAAQQGPVDLVPAFAMPMPVLVIGELLGADPSVAAEVGRLRVAALTPGTPPEEAMAATRQTMGLMTTLIAATREHPGDDLLGELVGHDDFTDEELAAMAFILLVAGHETTANMLALCVLLILTDDALRAAAAAGPLPDATINELLRYMPVVHYVARSALRDVEIGGELIRAGETVTVSLAATNRDPARYTDPEAFHVAGTQPGHLAFGHGPHQCIGSSLARAELRIGIAVLMARFPGLRLAVPADEVPDRDGMTTYGLQQLPVAW